MQEHLLEVTWRHTEEADVQTDGQQHTQQTSATEQQDRTWREDNRVQVHCINSDRKMETKQSCVHSRMQFPVL